MPITEELRELLYARNEVAVINWMSRTHNNLSMEDLVSYPLGQKNQTELKKI
jgi:hypothetical protein